MSTATDLPLAGKRLVLGITGGIAAYKMAEFIRRGRELGLDIQVVMTPGAQRFMTPLTLQALSGHPVLTDVWNDGAPDGMAHIHASRQADAILVAPATADFLARLAQGRSDDLLAALCLARDNCPLLVAPAMNHAMWAHPATQRHAAQLRADGVRLLGPDAGEQACGEVGAGRLWEPARLLSALSAHFTPQRLAGRRVLITAGPTSEPVDPVRMLTNRSSGKMGYAIAQAAQQAGAQVTLVSGPTALPTPWEVDRINVQTAREMYDAVMARTATHDVFIAVAAVADWHVANAADHKLKKTDGGPPVLEFAANPDILADVARLPDGPWCVGFAAETDHLIEHASLKRHRKGVPLLVANLAQDSMDADHTTMILIDADGATPLPRLPKAAAARALVEAMAIRLPKQALGDKGV